MLLGHDVPARASIAQFDAFDLLARIAVDPDNYERYPDGTVLIPADSPDTALLLSRSLAKRRPTVLVLPDGAVSIRAGYRAKRSRSGFSCHAGSRGFLPRRSRYWDYFHPDTRAACSIQAVISATCASSRVLTLT